MRFCEPGVMEYQLEAEILHEFAMAGARHPAYNTIVGGGKNGCILHYIDNKDALRNGDLVLIDAGCELEYYAADITRRSEEHTSELQSRGHLVCRLLLEKKKATHN